MLRACLSKPLHPRIAFPSWLNASPLPPRPPTVDCHTLFTPTPTLTLTTEATQPAGLQGSGVVWARGELKHTPQTLHITGVTRQLNGRENRKKWRPARASTEKGSGTRETERVEVVRFRNRQDKTWSRRRPADGRPRNGCCRCGGRGSVTELFA